MRQFLSSADFRKFKSSIGTAKLNGGLDVLVPTMSGNFRGKRIPLGDMAKLINGQLTLPMSAMTMDAAGETPLLLAEGSSDGDPDIAYLPLRHSLSLVPWSVGSANGGSGQSPNEQSPNEQNRAQIMVTADEKHKYANDYQNPRKILQKACDLLHGQNLYPHAAIELEFFLINPQSTKDGRLQPPLTLGNLRRLTADQCLSLQALEDFQPFLQRLNDTLQAQNLHPQAVSAEYSFGQFEINQPHEQDLLLVCDRALLLKHAVKSVARQFGMEATFMAKPYLQKPGSGMHVHVSLCDKAGNNIFAAKNTQEFSQKFHYALGGLSKSAADFFILFAPLGNSYRRFCGNAFAPVNSAWGRNNRSVALRVPQAHERRDVRLEHRLAGADACPYLAMAAILFGIDYGLKHKTHPARESVRDKIYQKYDLPLRWGEALYRFQKSKTAAAYLGKEAHRFLYGYYASEYEAYHNYMPRRDSQRYLEGT